MKEIKSGHHGSHSLDAARNLVISGRCLKRTAKKQCSKNQLKKCAQPPNWPSKLLFGDVPVPVFIPVFHLICFVFCLTSLLLMYRSPRFNSKCSRCGSNNRCPNKWTCTMQALACLDLLRHQWQMAGCRSNPCHFPSSNILSLSPQDPCLGTWDLEISPWGLYLAQAKLSVTSCGNNEVVINM